MFMRQAFLRWSFIFFLALSGNMVFMKPSEGLSLSASFPKSDSLLLSQIQAQITADKRLSGLPVEVTVANGQVSFKGSVAKKAQAIALIILAESTAGVQGVEVSDLSLQAGSLSSDDLVNSLVIGTFQREGLMGPLSQLTSTKAQTGISNLTYKFPPRPIHIQVKTRDGVVYLSGKVPDQATLDQAISLARSISGVVDVESELVSDH